MLRQRLEQQGVLSEAEDARMQELLEVEALAELARKAKLLEPFEGTIEVRLSVDDEGHVTSVTEVKDPEPEPTEEEAAPPAEAPPVAPAEEEAAAPAQAAGEEEGGAAAPAPEGAAD